MSLPPLTQEHVDLLAERVAMTHEACVRVAQQIGMTEAAVREYLVIEATNMVVQTLLDQTSRMIANTEKVMEFMEEPEEGDEWKT